MFIKGLTNDLTTMIKPNIFKKQVCLNQINDLTCTNKEINMISDGYNYNKYTKGDTCANTIKTILCISQCSFNKSYFTKVSELKTNITKQGISYISYFKLHLTSLSFSFITFIYNY